jgi:GT2 family glycosyltransferase
MKLLTCIVNYRTADMTLEAVQTLLPELEPYPDARVVIVDNDSGDGSLEKMSTAVNERGWGERVQVLASDRNGGFAYGNNFAIRRALSGDDPPDYVYLLNSDAFPEKGAVRCLVDLMDAHPQVGICGSYIHGPDGEPHRTAFRFPTIWSELEATLGLGVVTKLLDRHVVAMPMPAETQQVDWLAGASMLIRREVFEDIGLMDETFFLYYEETDFCRRAALAGWPTYYVVESSVAHIGSASTGLKDKSRPTPRYWYESRRHYFLKNHGRPYLWAANAVYVTCGTLRRIRWRVQGKPEFEAKNHLRDFVAFNFRPQRSR